jgi:hypothetical protein
MNDVIWELNKIERSLDSLDRSLGCAVMILLLILLAHVLK